jgi:hypothetical protein
MNKRRSMGVVFGNESGHDVYKSAPLDPDSPTKDGIGSSKVSIVDPSSSMPYIAKPNSKGKLFGMDKSMDSFNSGGTGLDGNSGKPLVENNSTKFFFFRFTMLAFLLNVVLVLFGVSLRSSEGFLIKIPWIELDEVGPIMLVTLMWATHILTYTAFNDALSVYFGMLLCQTRGFAVSVTGLIQGNLLQKIVYASQLSIRSKAKRIATRLSFVFLLHSALLVIPLVAVFEIMTTVRVTDAGGLSCIIYHQNGKQNDRGWPTLQVEMGVGEYVFGTSIGNLRSQEDVEKTNFVMAPQLTDTCNDGTTISGDGFMMNIFTECTCAGSSNASDLINNGIPAADAATFSDLFASLGRSQGMVHGVYMNGQDMSIYTLLSRTNVCGGGMSQPVPVCQTNLTDIHVADIEMKYMTDGTPASIAAKKARILKVKEKADMEWLYKGYTWIMNGRIAAVEMPGLYPNTVNPLLWWTTQNTMEVSASLLEAGVETTIALMNKAVIQRSFNVEGKLCPQTVVITDERVARTNDVGLRYILIFAGGQFAMQVLCAIVFVYWTLHKIPIIPGIRFVREKTSFMILASSPSVTPYLAGLTATFEPNHFWPKFDMTMRVGESIHTLDDPDYGMIVIERPKMVGDLSFSKSYV